MHVGSSEGTIVCADVGFVEELAEIVVGATKATIEDGGEGGLGIAAVGRGVVTGVFADKTEGAQTTPPIGSPPTQEGNEDTCKQPSEDLSSICIMLL